MKISKLSVPPLGPGSIVRILNSRDESRVRTGLITKVIGFCSVYPYHVDIQVSLSDASWCSSHRIEGLEVIG